MPNSLHFLLYRLGFFERKNSFFNISQLISQVRRHYVNEARNQLYVLVLGLDVLGNPFGLVRGIAEGGYDLFNEPIKVFRNFTYMENIGLVKYFSM